MRLASLCGAVALPLAVDSSLAAAPGLTAAETRADKQFTTYAYAHEFGSGIYDFSGRTLQVYGLPDRVDSISFVPGVELDFMLGARWHLLPYAQAGSSFASERDVETVIVGAGLRAQRNLALDAFDGRYSSEGIYSGVHYRGDFPDDDFVRWRNAVSFGRRTGLDIAGHELRAGGFWLVDAYVDPPTGPTTGLDVPRLQIEAGVMLGAADPWRVWGLALPQLGLSYRFAGALSGVKFVIGAPF